MAERAGVNEVTLFRHFESKLGIVRALGATLDLSERPYPPGEVIVEGDVRATLRNLAAVEMAAAATSGPLVLRLSFDARSVPELAEAMGQVSDSNLRRLTAWLGAAQERGELRADLEAELLAEAFFNLTSTLVMSRTAVGAPAPTGDEIEHMAERQMQLLWSGIGPLQD
jgi:AcrR family transcriptional regulator